MTDIRRSAAISGALHVALLAVAYVGLPSLWTPPPVEERPLIVEALPLAAITNAPPPRPDPPRVEPPKPEPPKAQEQPKPEPPPPPPPPPPPTPPPPAPPPPTPPPPTPPPPPEPTPIPLPPPPAPPPPTPPPVPPPPAPPPPAPPPPTPPPPVPAPPRPPPPPPARPQQTFDPDAVLRDLQRARPQTAQRQEQTAQAAPAARASSNAPHNPLQPLSMTEEDAIRQKVSRIWNVDVGAKGVETFVVVLKLFVTADGTVRNVEIIERQGTPAEPLRAFAESARRAVIQASPLPLPPGKAQQLIGGNLELRFTGREMLGIRG